jgi:hypothetical protein
MLKQEMPMRVVMLSRGVALCAVMMVAACDAPDPVQDGPVAISAQDLFVVRAGQVASAKMLAANCPRYGFSQDRQDGWTAQTIAQIEAGQSTAETRRQLATLRNQLPVETARYVDFFRGRNNLGYRSNVSDYCRVADRERSKATVVGQLLVPGGSV